jgi:hypothetical protein
MRAECTRRNLLHQSLLAGSALLVSERSFGAPPKAAEASEPEVTATEDLMREHGVIRRALLVYAESIPRLRQNAEGVDSAALHRTAQLFRTFGEDYHERMLEEHTFSRLSARSTRNSHTTPTSSLSNMGEDVKLPTMF